MFPNEPVLTVCAPAIEAQIIETFVLLTLNHQTLIATKANRIVRAAQAEPCSSSAHAALRVRAAPLTVQEPHISAVAREQPARLRTSFIPCRAGGTMGSFVGFRCLTTSMTLLSRIASFIPTTPTLLVDTYNTIKSGVPNAIKVFKEVLLPQGKTKCAIRLDVWAIFPTFPKKARKMLDDAGTYTVQNHRFKCP